MEAFGRAIALSLESAKTILAKLHPEWSSKRVDEHLDQVLKDIADEERVHAGEFLRLLHELAPEEEKFYAEGAEEVEEEMGKSK